MSRNAAAVEPWLQWIWRAFWALHADRPRIMVPIPTPLGGFLFAYEDGRIPWTAVDRYARRHDVEDFDMLVRLIVRMDDEYADWQRAQRQLNGR